MRGVGAGRGCSTPVTKKPLRYRERFLGCLLDCEGVMEGVSPIAGIVAVAARGEKVIGLGIETVGDRNALAFAGIEGEAVGAGWNRGGLAGFGAGVVGAGGAGGGGSRRCSRHANLPLQVPSCRAGINSRPCRGYWFSRNIASNTRPLTGVRIWISGPTIGYYGFWGGDSVWDCRDISLQGSSAPKIEI